ncbi:MAG: alpha/beta hydrolase [Alphaproteobacteria bacterium]|nr:alpha/beta hydrolase [Alphaproteobacteria bacterium]
MSYGCRLLRNGERVVGALPAGSYIPLGENVARQPDLKSLSLRAPALAGDMTYERFCVPRFSEYRTPDHLELVTRARHHLRRAKLTRVKTHVGETVVYELDPDGGVSRGSILVVHGWTSEASFMMALGEPLRRSGFRVVLVDCPAHGRSHGERTTLIDCAKALVHVADVFGPFDGVLAHSMGSLAALMAGVGAHPLAHGVPFERYCIIAAPNKFSEVTGRFSARLGISAAAHRHFERQLSRIAHMSMRDYCGERFLKIVDKPVLVIHARDDQEVPFHNAVEMAESCRNATLMPFDGLGHRKVLYVPPVVRAVAGFFRNAGGGATQG